MYSLVLPMIVRSTDALLVVAGLVISSGKHIQSVVAEIYLILESSRGQHVRQLFVSSSKCRTNGYRTD